MWYKYSGDTDNIIMAVLTEPIIFLIIIIMIIM